MNPSEEQIQILQELEEYNVIVDAVPGSGKTTTILFVIEKFVFDENILVLTYNRKLREETKYKVMQKCIELEVDEPEVHTFHSFCAKTYGTNCSTDKGIMQIMDNNMEPKLPFDYSMIIVDEAQDLTKLYYQVVRKIWQPDTKLLILGDKYQSIYGFNGADFRFLTLADKLFLESERQFKFITLSTSYRLTKPVADFLNTYILAEKRKIKHSPHKLEGPQPQYWFINMFIFSFRENYEYYYYKYEQKIEEEIKNINGDHNKIKKYILQYIAKKIYTENQRSITNLKFKTNNNNLENVINSEAKTMNGDFNENKKNIIRDIGNYITYDNSKNIAQDIAEKIYNEEIPKVEKSPIIRKILKFIESGKYKYEDIFILAPSTSSNNKKSPMITLANGLTHCGIPIFVPTSDDSAIDEKDVKGKIVFCTFHKAKGLERKIIFVIGCDESYIKYFNKNYDGEECCNVLYVALTRSMEHLFIVQHYKNRSLKFMHNISKKYKKFGHSLPYEVTDKKYNISLYTLHPSSIVQHLNSKITIKLANMINYKIIRDKGKFIKIPIRHEQDDEMYEIVCDLNGYFAVGCYEHDCNPILNTILMSKNEAPIFGNIKIHKLETITVEKIDELLRQTTKTASLISGLIFKTEQIKYYNWLTLNNVKNIRIRMFNTMPQKCKTEKFYKGRIYYNKIDKKIIYGCKYCTNTCICKECLHYIGKLLNLDNCKECQNLNICKKCQELKKNNCQHLKNRNCYYCKINDCIYDHKICNNCNFQLYKSDIISIYFAGYVDIYDDQNGIIWEIKCVEELKDSHYMQLLAYKFIIEYINGITTMTKRDGTIVPIRYYLYNVRTNEIHELTMDMDVIISIMEYLIYKKFVKQSNAISDNKFLAKVR